MESGEREDATGFGSMPLGNVWAFPSRALTYDQTLGAMRFIARGSPRITATAGSPATPSTSRTGWNRSSSSPRNDFAALHRWPSRCRSSRAGRRVPFDAALHDAFGKVHGLNCYQHLRPRVPRDTTSAHYLGAEFAGERLDDFVTPEPKPRMPLYHLVGALDPLTPADVKKPVGDGLPEHLGEWIRPRRPDAPEDQAQRRRPRLGRGARRAA